MSIYHLSVKAISRGDGRSAVACAAYRSGEKLACNYYDKTQDYTKKSGVEFTHIYAPPNTNPELLDRQTLWNTVEKVERRKDAILAREFEIAFPSELNADQRKQLLDELCQKLVEKYGVVVDAAIHAPHTESGSDARNYHAHIMFTTRAINENGEFAAKKYRDFSRDNGTQEVCDWRADFADLCNKHLEQAGFDQRVDHRSYADQNKDYLEPTVHEGPAVTAMRRRGIDTEISLNNDEIKVRNADAIERHEQIIAGLDQEIIVPKYINDQINALENELRLTESEEHELLAEFAGLDQEEEKLQTQQTQAIDYAYDQFIELQYEYAQYAQNYQNYKDIKDKEIADKQRERDKSVKYMQKHGYENDNLFISAAYSNHVEKPSWFISESDMSAFKHLQHKTFKESAKNDLHEISRIYAELDRHAQILRDHDIELPTATVKKSSMFGLIKKEVELDYTWRDLDAKMYESGEYHQVLNEMSDDQNKYNAQMRSDASNQQEENTWAKDLAKENKARIAQENANKQHIQNQPENTIQNTPKPKPKKISNDNDSFGPGF